MITTDIVKYYNLNPERWKFETADTYYIYFRNKETNEQIKFRRI